MPGKKTAVQKRDAAPPARIEWLAAAKGRSFPAGRMLISSPADVGRVIRQIPVGSILTVESLRAVLAAEHQADYTCPLTTGIFLRLVAEAAEEESGGSPHHLPYWRVVRSGGQLIEKLPGGQAAQAERLRAEGIRVTVRGKSFRVLDPDQWTWKPSL
jgi:alkylated DNA nucleotide flippase Atl1